MNTSFLTLEDYENLGRARKQLLAQQKALTAIGAARTIEQAKELSLIRKALRRNATLKRECEKRLRRLL